MDLLGSKQRWRPWNETLIKQANWRVERRRRDGGFIYTKGSERRPDIFTSRLAILSFSDSVPGVSR